jgi:hypothetical protein
MSQNACTTQEAWLDSVFDDAPEALRGVAARNFRGKKKSANIFPEGVFEASQTHARKPNARESVLVDSQTRVLGSSLQALDEGRRRSSPRRFPSAEVVAEAAARRFRQRCAGAIAAITGRASP